MNPLENDWIFYGVPAGALLFAGVGSLWLWILGRRFDRKYGHTYPSPDRGRKP